MKGRPNKELAPIYEERNKLILQAITDGFSQVDVSVMFRVPRNTIHIIVKKKLSTGGGIAIY